MKPDLNAAIQPLVVGLNAVIFAASEGELKVLVTESVEGGEPALPFGPFDPSAHRTFEIGLREWVRDQTGFELGYVEQLYTFGDRGREAPLAALALWWLLARALPFAAPELPLALLALVDGGFYLALAALILREIVLAKNRNLPVVLAIALFGLADLLDYAGSAGLIGYDIGHRAGIALAVTLVSLIGGRIVPSFTRNWMQREGLTGSLPSQPTRFDIAVVLATALALGAWMLAGTVPPVGVALVFAGSIQLVRLARWRGWRTLASPIVLVLHLGYVWIPLGLLLLGIAALGAPIPASAGVHALGVGALAGMILAVMTRATLGHTGRALHAGPATRASYLALHLAVLARVAASLVPAYYQSLLHLAGALWIAAFALFVLAYAPVMLRPRPGE